MKNFAALVITGVISACLSACSSAPDTSSAPVVAVRRVEAVPLASSVATPVPIARARPNAGVGRNGTVRNGWSASAIIEDGGMSCAARPGELIASRYRVLAIGPGYVRL